MQPCGIGLVDVTFKHDLGVLATVDVMKEASQTPQLQSLKVSTE